jgi:hypothetical protein
VTTRRTTLARPAALLAAAVLAVGLLGGCGSDDVSCGLDACTVTYEKGVSAGVSVLGVEAKMVSADNNTVTLEIAGEKVQLTTGQPAVEVAGLQVSVDSITDSQVKVRIGK